MYIVFLLLRDIKCLPPTKELNLDAKRQNHWLFPSRHWLFPSRHWLFLSRHWLFPSRHLQWVPRFTSVCCTSFCKRRCIHMYAFIIVVNGIRVRVRVLSATFNTISAI